LPIQSYPIWESASSGEIGTGDAENWKELDGSLFGVGDVGGLHAVTAANNRAIAVSR